MIGWELRELRKAQNLTLGAVSRAAGTSASNLSAYEHGRKQPNQATLNRLQASIAVGAASPIHRSALVTVPACAAAIRADLRSGQASRADTLRYVREMINNTSFVVGNDADRAAFFAEPSTTGDQRWDALLAGVVDCLAQQYGFEAPSWTASRYVTPFWFVGSTPALHAYAYSHSPAPLANRGVFIDPADLESV
jgi:transcriptional regulator with XRE-family HTH domain